MDSIFRDGTSSGEPPEVQTRAIDANLSLTIEGIERETKTTLSWRCLQIRSSGEVRSDVGTASSPEKIYCIGGGLAELFVTYSLQILMKEKRISIDDEIAKHLNIDLSPHNTTIRDLLLQTNSIKPMNDFLLGPDGKVLVLKAEFLEVAENAIHFAPPVPEDNWHHSNFNFILSGLIIEAVAGKPVGDFIKEKLIVPLKLDHTCSTEEDFQRLNSLGFVEPPKIVDTKGKVTYIDPPQYFNTIGFAPLAMYSSVNDITTFLCTIVDKSNGFDPQDFFNPHMTLNDGVGTKYSYFGCCMPLDNAGRANISLNSVVAPSSRYPLGIRQSMPEREMMAYHVQGAIAGYTSDAYILFRSRTIIVTLGTASLVAATDYASRAILQEKFLFQTSAGREVDIPVMAKKGMEEAARWFETRFPTPSRTALDLVHATPGLHGFFTNKDSKQSFDITRKETHYELAVTGSGGRSERLWLYPANGGDDCIWIRPEPPKDIATVGIDIQYSWFPLSFTFLRTRDRIMTLKRRSPHGTLVYTRNE